MDHGPKAQYVEGDVEESQFASQEPLIIHLSLAEA